LLYSNAVRQETFPDQPEDRQNEATPEPDKDPIPQQVGFAAVYEKVWDPKNRKTYIDDVTGLPNRQALDLYIDAAIEDRTSDRNTRPLSLLFIDIDAMHSIDKRGHDVGDDVLRALSIGFRKNLRQEDVLAVGRKHGDEFVFLTDMAPREVLYLHDTHLDPTQSESPNEQSDAPHGQVASLTERIRAVPDYLRSVTLKNYEQKNLTLEEARLIIKIQPYIKKVKRFGVSIGTANWEHGMSAKELTNNADQAAIQDKQQRKKAFERGRPRRKRLAIRTGRILFRYGFGEDIERD